jgi:valyl-tRNA synthetase
MKLPKTYEPKLYEEDIYALWEKNQAFSPQGDGPAFSLVVPPPNANGGLHLGSALTYSIEDIIIRYHRLIGDRTLFLPGADHAGFETWVVYEKQLAKEGKSRFDFSREELYRQVWDFVAQNRANIEAQFRLLGASIDWNRFTFTLDGKIVRQAYNTFKRMWDEKLIYRGERLVNFCTFHGTSFADIEVEYKEEKGDLFYICYPLTDGTGQIIVATTRPETMLGDSGVAVNPDDDRYRAYVGRTVKLPLVDREIPIVSDSFVDQKFGTGAVKLTPAHAQNDFDVGQKHHLPFISVITTEGVISDIMPERYRGLKVIDARNRVVKDLEEQGFLFKIDKSKHSVGHCYKCGTIIEPLLREQWFVDMAPLAKRAVEALETDQIKFLPAAKKTQLVNYLKQLRDWNISRQIAWGIPIPAFQNIDEPDDWIYNEDVHKELIEVNGKTYRRDPDVFDTWFSSSSWPYATLDFPQGQDYKDFYPLSLMETGGDLLYPWVSRMIMLGLYVTGKVPFEAVYTHGLVMTSIGAKMSKSRGNAVDFKDVISQFGSDALRIGLNSSRSAGINRGYDPRKIEDARNFCNKLWNIARYIEDKVGDDYKRELHVKPSTLADFWILTKLQQTLKGVGEDMNNLRLSEAFDRIYHFVWDDFADWYIESSKLQPNPDILETCLEVILKITHPFAPYVTETIWQTLKWQPQPFLITSHWPEMNTVYPEQSHEFEEIKSIITEVRYLKNSLKITKTRLHYIVPQFVIDNAKLIEQLTKVETVTEVQVGPGLRLIKTPYQCWLDVDRKLLKQYIRDVGRKQKIQKDTVLRLEARLTNTSYTAKAPPEIIEQTKKELLEAQEVLETINQEYRRYVPPETIKPTQPSDAQPTQPAPPQPHQ